MQSNSALSIPYRKIIHVDMDCFYAAVEIRDNPSLADKPVAVGGPADARGVLCTCNYIARQYGVRSAMATSLARQYCKDLIVLPVNMAKYRQVAEHIHAIFREYTDLVEPLSLDEAYLDVTNSPYHQGSATLIAKEIRQRIWDAEKLTASAGVATNKFLAKIASGWKKPNALFVIRPNEIESFIKTLPVEELFGVGKVTAKRLYGLGIKTCHDLQQLALTDLIDQFGKLGQRLYEQCRGIDERDVVPNRIRKSLSVERTFSKDITDKNSCFDLLNEIHGDLTQRLQQNQGLIIKNQFVKIKFSDFKLKTAEIMSHDIDLGKYHALFTEALKQQAKAIRLLGLGVHFKAPL